MDGALAAVAPAIDAAVQRPMRCAGCPDCCTCNAYASTEMLNASSSGTPAAHSRYELFGRQMDTTCLHHSSSVDGSQLSRQPRTCQRAGMPTGPPCRALACGYPLIAPTPPGNPPGVAGRGRALLARCPFVEAGFPQLVKLGRFPWPVALFGWETGRVAQPRHG